MKKDIDEQISILMLRSWRWSTRMCPWILKPWRSTPGWIIGTLTRSFFEILKFIFISFKLLIQQLSQVSSIVLWSTFSPSSSCSSASKELQMTLSRATQLLDQESVGIQKIDKDHLFVTNIISFVFVKKSFSRTPLLLSLCLHGGQRLRQWQYEQERKDNLNKFFMRR